jgi:hypothetical protein
MCTRVTRPWKVVEAHQEMVFLAYQVVRSVRLFLKKKFKDLLIAINNSKKEPKGKKL